jgi:hypothetical protein
MPLYKIEVGIVKRRDYLGALDMGGRIITELKPIIKTSDLNIWVRASWIRVRSSGGLL